MKNRNWTRYLYAALFILSEGVSTTLVHATSVYDGFNPDPNGIVYSMAVQADNKILICGDFTDQASTSGARPHIARYNADGSLDLSFSVYPNDSIWSMAVQTDGKILVTGAFTSINDYYLGNNYIARLNADGSLDEDFKPPRPGSFINAMLVQADGKILIGGDFTFVSGQPSNRIRNRIARLNSDGSLDKNFDPDANGSVFSMVLQANGKIVVGGDFTTMGGQPRNRIARLNSDGSLDTNFDADADYRVLSVALQADGEILVGGDFSSVNGKVRNSIARLNRDGSLDDGFNPDANIRVQSLAVQTNGKILVGGWFTTMGGQTRNRIARLNRDGSLDTGFNPDANERVNSVAVQADGRMLTGGLFTTIGGQTRNYAAMLTADEPALQKLSVSEDGTVITWTRSGPSPEVYDVIFSDSADKVTWNFLGKGTRTSEGWQLLGRNLPKRSNRYLRAQGKAYGGYFNSSTSSIQSVKPYFLDVPENFPWQLFLPAIMGKHKSPPSNQ